MKKSFYLLIFLVAMFIGMNTTKAWVSYYINEGNNYDYNCTQNGAIETCNLKITVEGGTLTPANRFRIHFSMINLTFQKDRITMKDGWHLVEAGDDYIVVESERTSFPSDTYSVATLIYTVGTTGVGCRLTFDGFEDYFIPYYCQIKNGKYYDEFGNNVSYNEYLASCAKCAKKGEIDNNWHGPNGAIVSEADYYRQHCASPICKEAIDSNGNKVHFGPDGSEISPTEFATVCEGKCTFDPVTNNYYDATGAVTNKIDYYKECVKPVCSIVTDGNSTAHFGPAGTEISEFEYKRTCEKPSCSMITDGNTTVYFNKIGEEVLQEAYQKSCFSCEIKNGQPYNKEGEPVSKYKYELSCSNLKCKILKNDEGKTVYYDNEGTEKDELTYLKQCAVHTCEILKDGTHYDKDGKVVNEEEYLKSCFKCRKEDNKYYDETGKETSEDKWKIMCEPHKCENFGDKYFNDKGALVTKEEYDKACTNPGTGSADSSSISYIVSGILIAGAIIFISTKYAKLRKI